MKNLIKVALTSSLLILAACDSQDPIFSKEEIKTAQSLRDTALKENVAYELLESLTTEIGPRMVGSANEERAILWTIDKLISLGFDKVYTEPVTVPRWVRGAAEAKIISPFPQAMHLTSLGFSVGTADGGIEAEVIHFATLDDLKNASESAAAGKIVFISNRMERTQNGSGYGKAVSTRSIGAIEAAKKGAIGLIIRSIGTDDHRIAHTGMMRYQDDVPKIPAAALSNPDADLMERQFERGLPVSIYLNMENSFEGDFVTQNVIGEITGSETPEEIIIIGAHLDSWDLGTGAIDDGAGMAITMAAGKMIADLPIAPRRTIRVIAFAAEEIGLMGGKAYLERHKANIDNLIIGAESDFGADRIYSFATNVREQALPAMAEIAAILKPLGIEQGNNDAYGGPDISPLKGAGMAVASLYQDGTRYFDIHHTADDTLDKVDPEQLTQNVAAYVAFTYLMAQHSGKLAKIKTQE
jgi:hypothetical protein